MERTPMITKMVAGKEVEVPIHEVWKSICKIVRLARITTGNGSDETDHEKYKTVRLAFLRERLTDLDGLSFKE